MSFRLPDFLTSCCVRNHSVKSQYDFEKEDNHKQAKLSYQEDLSVAIAGININSNIEINYSSFNKLSKELPLQELAKRIAKLETIAELKAMELIIYGLQEASNCFAKSYRVDVEIAPEIIQALNTLKDDVKLIQNLQLIVRHRTYLGLEMLKNHSGVKFSHDFMTNYTASADKLREVIVKRQQSISRLNLCGFIKPVNPTNRLQAESFRQNDNSGNANQSIDVSETKQLDQVLDLSVGLSTARANENDFVDISIQLSTRLDALNKAAFAEKPEKYTELIDLINNYEKFLNNQINQNKFLFQRTKIGSKINDIFFNAQDINTKSQDRSTYGNKSNYEAALGDLDNEISDLLKLTKKLVAKRDQLNSSLPEMESEAPKEVNINDKNFWKLKKLTTFPEWQLNIANCLFSRIKSAYHKIAATHPETMEFQDKIERLTKYKETLHKIRIQSSAVIMSYHNEKFNNLLAVAKAWNDGTLADFDSPEFTTPHPKFIKFGEVSKCKGPYALGDTEGSFLRIVHACVAAKVIFLSPDGERLLNLLSHFEGIILDTIDAIGLAINPYELVEKFHNSLELRNLTYFLLESITINPQEAEDEVVFIGDSLFDLLGLDASLNMYLIEKLAKKPKVHFIFGNHDLLHGAGSGKKSGPTINRFIKNTTSTPAKLNTRENSLSEKYPYHPVLKEYLNQIIQLKTTINNNRNNNINDPFYYLVRDKLVINRCLNSAGCRNFYQWILDNFEPVYFDEKNRVVHWHHGGLINRDYLILIDTILNLPCNSPEADVNDNDLYRFLGKEDLEKEISEFFKKINYARPITIGQLRAFKQRITIPNPNNLTTVFGKIEYTPGLTIYNFIKTIKARFNMLWLQLAELSVITGGGQGNIIYDELTKEFKNFGDNNIINFRPSDEQNNDLAELFKVFSHIGHHGPAAVGSYVFRSNNQQNGKYEPIFFSISASLEQSNKNRQSSQR